MLDNEAPRLVDNQVDNVQIEQTVLSSWTRGRLVSVNGVWRRFGRLKRVYYRE